MGAKQSKRSVDISGKEAENAGEVAAAGAGGEGRVEQLADADADIKPQLNGDAHIQPPLEISDKEKQLDSGTPENEKDATTEKEGKEEQNGDKEPTPVTNGDSEPKDENGDSVPTPEDGKKPKKEKVKKKWSLRSISFSRKDKPKQEKKSKEEEPKTNGEPEKVPEEAAEATPESVDNKIAEVVQTNAEVKEEKTPETPVTEPMTNGSSTPESPKAELAAPAPAPATVETTPEQLPVNGLALDQPEPEPPAPPAAHESEPEAPAPEPAPAPEIPVKTEETAGEIVAAPVTTSEAENGEAHIDSEIVDKTPEVIKHEPEVIKYEDTLTNEHNVAESIKTHVETVEIAEIPKAEPELETKVVDLPSVEDNAPAPTMNGNGSIETQSPGAEDANGVDNVAPVEPSADTDQPDSGEELPPPPPEDELSRGSDDLAPAPHADPLLGDALTNNHAVDAEANDIADETEQKTLKNKKVDALGNIVDKIECNGNADTERLPPGPAPPPPARAASPPPPAAPAATEQEPLPIADKIADLIPEIPTIPELNTETESAVAVAD
ncbi:A-kinase anchor protein 200-like [Cydia pomonella]|uniref:A-kinase anchor protein 200-like n=1 Tax=Cydia pomonella TaxID=82600 RepID=UPI002ADE563A|nr:A-kinase anchor protein 200-like [Cydia pomonella]XP_061704030.1 A-kinase anchor protein 200-like [Cydia pomonella]